MEVFLGMVYKYIFCRLQYMVMEREFIKKIFKEYSFGNLVLFVYLKQGLFEDWIKLYYIFGKLGLDLKILFYLGQYI